MTFEEWARARHSAGHKDVSYERYQRYVRSRVDTDSEPIEIEPAVIEKKLENFTAGLMITLFHIMAVWAVVSMLMTALFGFGLYIPPSKGSPQTAALVACHVVGCFFGLCILMNYSDNKAKKQ